MSENQRDQSTMDIRMDISTLREKMAVSAPFIRDGDTVDLKDYPFTVDPLMAGDKILANCCRMCSDNFELEMLPEVVTWIKREDIQVKFSVYFGIFHFKNDEDRVKFILRWL